MRDFHKKEKPLQGISGWGGGATALRMSSASTKTYIDDLFNTDLWNGVDDTAHTITNGIDFSEGGLIWHKKRNGSSNLSWHVLIDSLGGANNGLFSNNSNSQSILTGGSSFNANGFTWGSENNFHPSGVRMSSWSFRKAKGFFDVVSYTGDNSTSRDISHNLGSVPGMIIIKKTSGGGEWRIWHKDIPDKVLTFTNIAAASSATYFPSAPTNAVFSIANNSEVNQLGQTYVAYLYAGGGSTAATAKSVEFDGSNDYLSIPDSADFNLGTSSFTIEGWVHPDIQSMTSGYYGMICGQTSANWYITVRGGSGMNSMQYYDGVSAHNSAPDSIREGQWSHVAFVNNSGTGTWYINGVKSASTDAVSPPNIPNSSGAFEIGRNSNGSYFNGKISNLRVVKGTAVYTSSFRPSTAPLENITNTKLLCCNDSSQTGSTVTPGTITNNGSTASTESPFDDPAGFKFGPDGDKNIVKCGTYGGVAGYPIDFKVELGWEPQFFMVKNVGLDGNNNEWLMWDSMRGVVAQIDPNTGGNDARLSPTEDANEYSGDDQIEFHSTGVRVTTNDGRVNGGDGQKIIYIAIRRPDGYVGKPPEAATNVFTMDVGNGSGSGGSIVTPSFDSAFPVDFSFIKQPLSTADWDTSSRLTQGRYVKTNTQAAEATSDGYYFDSNVGWGYQSWLDSGVQSYMFKRHAGMDVITYDGKEVASDFSHSLNAVPEMMWFKRRGGTSHWRCWHKGLNAGVNAKDYMIAINDSDGDSLSTGYFPSLPTSTHVSLGHYGGLNYEDRNFIGILFSSVEGISKCGFYTGSASDLTIECGFQPRFVLIKSTTNNGYSWVVLDSLRTWGSGNDNYLQLNSDVAQVSFEMGAPTSTGFTVDAGSAWVNGATDRNYIYYAHA